MILTTLIKLMLITIHNTKYKDVGDVSSAFSLFSSYRLLKIVAPICPVAIFALFIQPEIGLAKISVKLSYFDFMKEYIFCS